MKGLRAFVLLIGLALGAAAHALDYGEKQDLAWNARLTTRISITGVTAADAPVSGTKVDVGTHFGAEINGVSPVSDVRAVKAVLNIDGTDVRTITASSGGGSGPGGGMRSSGSGGGETDVLVTWEEVDLSLLNPESRFSSNHFADDASIPITLTVDWELYRPEYGAWYPFTTTNQISVKAYNKVLAWKTIHDANGGNWTASDEAIIAAVLTAGRTGYTSAKYTSLLGTTDLFNRSQAAPDPDGAGPLTAGDMVGKPTALFANTHGESTGVQDSYAAPWMRFDDRLFTLAHPNLYAICAMYSCETLYQPNKPDALPFQHSPLGTTTQKIAAGYAGFKVTVYPNMKLTGNPNDPGIGKTLDEHASAFFGYLEQGYMLETARLKANKDIFNAATNNNPENAVARLLLSTYSDRYATLKYVYMNQAERSGAGLSVDDPDTHWYYPWN